MAIDYSKFQKKSTIDYSKFKKTTTPSTVKTPTSIATPTLKNTFNLNPSLGGGQFNVAQTPGALVTTPRAYGGVEAPGQYREHIFPVALGGTSNIDNIKVYGKDIGAKKTAYETDIIRQYKAGKLDLPEAQGLVLKKYRELTGIDAPTSVMGNLWEGIKKTATQIFPQTTQAIKEVGPSIKSEASKAASTKPLAIRAIEDYAKTLKEQELSGLQALKQIGREKTTTKSGFLGKTLETGAAATTMAIAPITSLFGAAKNIPIAGTVMSALNVPFGAIGDIATNTSNQALDSLVKTGVIKKEQADNVRKGVNDITSLAAQIYFGNKLFDSLAGKKKVANYSTLADYGKKDFSQFAERAGFNDVAAKVRNIQTSKIKSISDYSAAIKEIVGNNPELLKHLEKNQLPFMSNLASDKWIKTGDVEPRFTKEIPNETYLSLVKEYGKKDAETIIEAAKEKAKLELKSETIKAEPAKIDYAKFKKVEVPKIEAIKIEDPLIQEAKKYKSAEEFVKAQQPIYKGITIGNEAIGSFSTDINHATRRGLNLNKLTGVPSQTIEKYFNPNSKFVPFEEYHRIFNELKSEKITDNFFKNQGYDGVDFRMSPTMKGEIEKEIRIWNKDKLLTKSQLTDIWNKAQESPKKEQTLKTSGVSEGIEAKAIEEGMLKQGYHELADYDASTIKQQAALGSQYNIREITRIIKGEAPLPVGMKAGTPISIALDYAIRNRDVKLMRELVRSPLSSQISAYGSGLSLSKMINKDTPLSAIEEIANARKKAAEKRTGKKESTIEKEKKAEVESKKKTIEREKPSKYDWNKLINEIACR